MCQEKDDGKAMSEPMMESQWGKGEEDGIDWQVIKSDKGENVR